jgi:hypothetical protein
MQLLEHGLSTIIMGKHKSNSLSCQMKSSKVQTNWMIDSWLSVSIEVGQVIYLSLTSLMLIGCLRDKCYSYKLFLESMKKT